MKQILNKIKQNKKILIPLISIVLLLVLLAGVSFAVFNYSNDNAGNNDINSGHISMAYTEPSNEYEVENALPMKDAEGMNSSNYFEFSVTTTAPTEDTDDNGVSIPYEITITESEGNTLTNDKIKMYVTEVEGEQEISHTNPTLVSYFEPSLYKDNQIKVGFNLHLHRNGNETVTIKYRLRVWVDYDTDVSDWDTAGEFVYKFKVNVNGEATYQGYETDQSCFELEENARGNYSITGYDFNKCGNKNIAIPDTGQKKVLYKEIKAINMPPEDQVVSAYGDYYFASYCSGYADLDSCLSGKGIPKEYFEQDILNNFNKFTALAGQNYYDHISEINELEGYSVSLGLDVEIIYGEEEEIINHVKIDEIKVFKNVNVIAVASDKNVYSVNNLNNVVENIQNTALTVANTKPIINGLIIPEDIIITNDAFSTLEINQLVDRKGNFPKSCFLTSSNDDLVTISEYLCLGVSNPKIPSIIEDLPVKVIGELAFFNHGLESVVIPNSVTTIGEFAFSANNLINIVIPEGITEIKQGAFSANKLINVTLPNSVITIGSNAFYNNNLTNINLPASLKFIEEHAFDENKLTEIIIPSNVVSIGEFAFASNQLTEIVIPNSVTVIRTKAFVGNYKLNKIVNKTGKPFDWTSIVSVNGGDSFITGIVATEYGNVEIVAE